MRNLEPNRYRNLVQGPPILFVEPIGSSKRFAAVEATTHHTSLQLIAMLRGVAVGSRALH